MAHEMAQSNYSKDFYAGSDFIIPGYNVHDAVKCMWNLAKISKALHPDDALPAMKLRHGPSDAEEAERRANSWDAMPFVPLTNLAAVGPETCQSQPQAISMQQLYRNAINKFWKWYGTKFWPAYPGIPWCPLVSPGVTLDPLGTHGVNWGHLRSSGPS